MWPQSTIFGPAFFLFSTASKLLPFSWSLSSPAIPLSCKCSKRRVASEVSLPPPPIVSQRTALCKKRTASSDVMLVKFIFRNPVNLSFATELFMHEVSCVSRADPKRRTNQNRLHSLASNARKARGFMLLGHHRILQRRNRVSRRDLLAAIFVPTSY